MIQEWEKEIRSWIGVAFLQVIIINIVYWPTFLFVVYLPVLNSPCWSRKNVLAANTSWIVPEIVDYFNWKIINLRKLNIQWQHIQEQYWIYFHSRCWLLLVKRFYEFRRIIKTTLRIPINKTVVSRISFMKHIKSIIRKLFIYLSSSDQIYTRKPDIF